MAQSSAFVVYKTISNSGNESHGFLYIHHLACHFLWRLGYRLIECLFFLSQVHLLDVLDVLDAGSSATYFAYILSR